MSRYLDEIRLSVKCEINVDKLEINVNIDFVYDCVVINLKIPDSLMCFFFVFLSGKKWRQGLL